MEDCPRFVTLGCRLNHHETAVMRRLAAKAGLDGRYVFVHGCAVTKEAERQTRQAARRARRRDPRATIVVTGCGAHINPASYKAMAEVDAVLDNRQKLDAAAYRRLGGDGTRQTTHATTPKITHATTPKTTWSVDFDGRSRATLAIQQGCDHRCTFCIIPQGRGGSRSLSPSLLAERMETLLAAGYREVTLTGVDIASWGRDLPRRPALGALVARLLRGNPRLARLRLSSLDPAAIDPQLEDLLGSHPRLMPYVHLSVQSGDDMILKRMRRRHDRAQVSRLCRRLLARRPSLLFGADLIAGFPTESDAMFESSLRLIGECPLTMLHVFPYSPREGTPAAHMPPVPPAIVKARAAELRRRGEEARRRSLAARVGAVLRVLAEEPRGGLSEDAIRVRWREPVPIGSLVTLRGVAVGADAASLRARVL